MFCSECGKPARGKFCAHCGTALDLDASAGDLVPVEIVPELDVEVRYQSILGFPGVRQKIERCAQSAPKRMTGEQFLALADKLVPLGVSMEGLAAIAQPLYAKLGIKTGKERVETVAAPAGEVIVRALCSLASHGQALRGVTQADDGCLLAATLPSDMFALEGALLVSIHRHGPHATVSAATNIGGQLFDWGKSTRCLNQLFADLAREAA